MNKLFRILAISTFLTGYGMGAVNQDVPAGQQINRRNLASYGKDEMDSLLQANCMERGAQTIFEEWLFANVNYVEYADADGGKIFNQNSAEREYRELVEYLIPHGSGGQLRNSILSSPKGTVLLKDPAAIVLDGISYIEYDRIQEAVRALAKVYKKVGALGQKVSNNAIGDFSLNERGVLEYSGFFKFDPQKGFVPAAINQEPLAPQPNLAPVNQVMNPVRDQKKNPYEEILRANYGEGGAFDKWVQKINGTTVGAEPIYRKDCFRDAYRDLVRNVIPCGESDSPIKNSVLKISENILEQHQTREENLSSIPYIRPRVIQEAVKALADVHKKIERLYRIGSDSIQKVVSNFIVDQAGQLQCSESFKFDLGIGLVPVMNFDKKIDSVLSSPLIDVLSGGSSFEEWARDMNPRPFGKDNVYNAEMALKVLQKLIDATIPHVPNSPSTLYAVVTDSIKNKVNIASANIKIGNESCIPSQTLKDCVSFIRKVYEQAKAFIPQTLEIPSFVSAFTLNEDGTFDTTSVSLGIAENKVCACVQSDLNIIDIDRKAIALDDRLQKVLEFAGRVKALK